MNDLNRKSSSRSLTHNALPPLGEADQLGEVGPVGGLAVPDEAKVQRDAGQDAGADVLADEIAAVALLAFVEDRHHVDVEPAALEADRHAMLLGHKLVPAHVGVRLIQPVGQPRHQLAVPGRGSLRGHDVHGGVQVVNIP